MPHRAGKHSSPSPVERLRQIANEIDGLPGKITKRVEGKLVDIEVPRPDERRLGELVEKAIYLGAFRTAEYAEFLNAVRTVRRKDGWESQVAYLAAMRVCRNLVVGLGLEGCFGPACHEIAHAIQIEADNLERLGGMSNFSITP